MNSWGEILDAMEARVAEAEGVIAGGGRPPAPVEIPVGAGPLPPSLRRRAETILGATVDAERRIEAQLGALAEARRRARQARNETPAYVDRRA